MAALWSANAPPSMTAPMKLPKSVTSPWVSELTSSARSLLRRFQMDAGT
ncbi:MAG: hypothetical protein BWY91_01291 [bacterium ADurb.BinA028]|nr:MAG: hypothetical protein BWY91_01291 [bacterium ADurb.BinA028]